MARRIKRSQPDKVEKLLEEYPDVFADIVNVLVFDGREVVLPENLNDGPTAGMYKAAEGYINQKDRDVLKFDRKNNVTIALYGLENQTKVSHVMPGRVMGYDYAVYDRNISKLKEQNRSDGIAVNFAEEIAPGQRICPVVTLVLYFGVVPWLGPKSLHDLLDIPEGLEPFVSNYQMNLVEVAFLEEEVITKFKSDFRAVAEFFRAKRLGNVENMRYNETKMIHISELIEFFKTFTHDSRFMKIKEDMLRMAERGEVKVCTLVDSLIAEGRSEGIIEGRSEGIIAGKSEFLDRMIKKGFSREEVMTVLELTEEEVTQYKAWK